MRNLFVDMCDTILAWDKDGKHRGFIDSIREAILFNPAKYPTDNQIFWLDTFYQQALTQDKPKFVARPFPPKIDTHANQSNLRKA